jgi:hypothetical protein
MFSEQFYIDPALAKHALSNSLLINIKGYIFPVSVGCYLPESKLTGNQASVYRKTEFLHLKFLKP